MLLEINTEWLYNWLMETLVQSDIFFFVSSISVALVSVALIIAVVYAIRVLRDVSHISRKAKEESDELAKDIKELRKAVKEEGSRGRATFRLITGLISSFFSRGAKKKKR